ncbi:unnamed protein product [Diamesa serratosioi]
MEISETTKFTFYLTRFFGLAPYKIFKKHQNSKIISYQKSLPLVFYSVVIVLLIVILTFRGIFLDAKSKTPIRMTTATAKVVVFMDIMVVVLVCMAGLCCGINNLKTTQDFNQRLQDVDHILDIYASSNPKQEKIKSFALMTSVGLALILVTGLDNFAWIRNAQKVEDESGDVVYENVLGYIPFYILYYMMLTLQLVFAQTALGLGRRYSRLNNGLKNILKTGETCLCGFIHFMSNAFAGGSNILASQIERLSETHDTLDKAVNCVSQTFGPALLAIVGSCLLHLVATSYFFLIEILGQRDTFFAYIQFLWLLFHCFRLMLCIEPCHVTYVEARNTITIVCDLMRNVQDPCLQETLKMFWRQLLAHETTFTACGMMTKIDRQILTSFLAALATYLIILMQFQKADG